MGDKNPKSKTKQAAQKDAKSSAASQVNRLPLQPNRFPARNSQAVSCPAPAAQKFHRSP